MRRDTPSTRGVPKTTARSSRQGRNALLIIVVLLGASGLIRLGDNAGKAFARSAEPAPNAAAECEPAPDAMALFEALRQRESALNEREARIEDRMHALAIAQTQVDLKLTELVAAEQKLARTISIADQGAEADVARLVKLYENMKPKEAAAVFSEMAPEFAAGFLALMRTDSAALVLAGLEPKTAYAISVLMAGRNANAPKN
jgi:flagellar motility protein MotE (MotC chaperone)